MSVWSNGKSSLLCFGAVVLMGPWSDQIFGPLGYSIPLNVKRGYHLHLKPRGNAVLHHPVLDSDQGFLLAPMNRGIRLATGAEFAHRDAPPTPVQVERALPKAHKLFPMEKLSVRGYVEALKHLPEIFGIRRKLGAQLIEDRPDLFIGIDAPDFNLGLEKRLKSAGIRTVHYVGPSLWAWGRRPLPKSCSRGSGSRSPTSMSSN